MPNGVLRFNDSLNRKAVDTRSKVKSGRWVRIEWKVNSVRGTVVMKLFNRANARKPTDLVRGGPGHSPSGRARTSSSSDDPGISRSP